MIGIIGAMEEEIMILKEHIEGLEEFTIAHVKFYKGKINDKAVVLTLSGIGKVNASISTALLIQQFSPEAILNTGSAGALDHSLNVGDVLIGTEAMYHDADATAFGYELGQIPNMPIAYEADDNLAELAQAVIEKQNLTGRLGMIVSGDSFIGEVKQREYIKEHFPKAMAVEMESAAIAQTCYQFNTPFIITRAVSDLANGEANITFDEFIGEAAKTSSETVLQMLKSL
ncbi:MAG: 5'-methylthioadenosine/adenosylhomocysteine nucleosidase [Staphylococcus simulans]|nr:5'-methylthioadenosine/adenosylhomocysteine nucleosidase [Staphylococcus simulans]